VEGGDPGPGGRYGRSCGVGGFTSENPSDSVEELRSSKTVVFSCLKSDDF